jgi:membrane-associated phospholipid phosphatase
MTFDLFSLMSVITESYIVVVPLVGLYMLFRKKKEVYPFIAAIILALVIVTAIKVIVAEPRPCAALGPELCEDPLESFPSRHAAAIGAGLIFVFFEAPLAAVYLAYFLLVCFSRVYLGAHYPHVVIAGAVIGLAIGFLCWKAKDWTIKIAVACVKMLRLQIVFPV